jgi:hypothetical protein
VRVRASLAGAAAVGLLLAGCGAPAGSDEVTATAREWLAAARARDGQRICQLLSPAAAESAATGGKTCAQAVGDLDLPGGGTVDAVQLWSDEAQVRTGEDTIFLVRLAGGWRVSAAGCTPRADRPYDCDVEA